MNLIAFQTMGKSSVNLSSLILTSTSSQENLSSGVRDQVRVQPACSATEACQILEIMDFPSADITLSRKRTTKALISSTDA